MSIEQLELVLPPPVSPLECPTSSAWAAVEARLGRLPSDYIAFASRYGTGAVDSFLWIFNPFSQNPQLNLERQAEVYSKVFHEINQSGLEAPITVFPEQRGLLPFGVTDNGDVLAWETLGEPDNWGVAVMPARSPVSDRFDFGMTRFLTAVCERRIRCEAFPSDFPSRYPRFEAAR